jgi:hypothetical protein
MAKKKTVLRVDVYPSDYSSNGTGVKYRFKVIDAKGVALAYSAKAYARTASAWKAAARLLLDRADVPSVATRKAR